MSNLPFVGELAKLEGQCEAAVKCLDPLIWAGPPNLPRLQELFGRDGESGIREDIRCQLRIVGQCFRSDDTPTTYVLNPVMAIHCDADGEVEELDFPHIDGTEEQAIEGGNAASALLNVLDRTSESLFEAIFPSGFYMDDHGKPFARDGWERLSNDWDEIVERLTFPRGLDLGSLEEAIKSECNAAKESLTFGADTSRSGQARRSRPKRNNQQPGLDSKAIAILGAHKRGQSHEETARIANVRTRNGGLDVALVERVLKAESARRNRRKR